MDELRARREEIYEKFDKINDSYDFFMLQKIILEEILVAERALVSKQEDIYLWREHLDRIYAVGDALVWTVLDCFTIRQLGKYESVRTNLLSQEDVIRDIVSNYEKKAHQGLYILADLTRCLTIGDVVEIIAPDKIIIHESKSSQPEKFTATNILRGRIGRQFSKAFWLQKLLENGFEKLYNQEIPTKVIEISSPKTTHIHLIPELVEQCLHSENGFAFIQPENGLVYLAKKMETNCELTDEELNSIPKLQSVSIASTARLIEDSRETMYHIPPLALQLPLKTRILLNEVEINILCLLSRNYIEEVSSNLGFIYQEDKDGLPQLSKGGKSRTFHVRFINDVMLNFVPLHETIRILTELFEALEETGDELTAEEKDYLEKRPKTRDEFVKYLQDNYVIAAIDDSKHIVEAYSMEGDILYKKDKEN
ncbi:hypothetical protein COE01_00670 [Bacillus thuringiensis]|uniref:hypothetical protein n=1 Tax=Bacillus thuringiensis TaxID=1428 RepID=UPI000BFE5A3B|nr:hypothetical protein [Bacillus thuringiensis]PGW87626.1 hypothetical protein COE01_00670 [Bacillus thuringiensis]